MKETENLIGEQPQDIAGQTLKAEEQQQYLSAQNQGSPILKFKSVEALSEAYVNLEKEFTQKCQKIKELTDKLDAKDNIAPAIPEYQEKDWEQKVKNFFEANPVAKNYVAEISEVLMSDDEIAKNKNSLNNALTKVLASKFVPQDRLAQDEEFLQKYIYQNPKVSQKIINNYLDNLQTNKALPLITSTSGSGTFSCPVKKPKTIKDAGKMVEAYFKN